MIRILSTAAICLTVFGCAAKQLDTLDPIAYESQQNTLFNALDVGRSARRACIEAPVPKPVCGELEGRWKRVVDYQFHYQRSQGDPVRRDETSSLELVEKGDRFCVGNPDDCIEYIERYEAMGVDEMMPLFQVGPVTHEEVMESLRLYGKYIIPHFQQKAKKAQAAAKN